MRTRPPQVLMPAVLHRWFDGIRHAVGTAGAAENARRSLAAEDRMRANVDALGSRLAILEARASRLAA